jgi:hypothetical protein
LPWPESQGAFHIRQGLFVALQLHKSARHEPPQDRLPYLLQHFQNHSLQVARPQCLSLSCKLPADRRGMRRSGNFRGIPQPRCPWDDRSTPTIRKRHLLTAPAPLRLEVLSRVDTLVAKPSVSLGVLEEFQWASRFVGIRRHCLPAVIFSHGTLLSCLRVAVNATLR